MMPGPLCEAQRELDELLRSKRLIALSDNAGHRRYPVFQFHGAQPLKPLIVAFWLLADAASSPWTAASWCVASDDDALGGLSPVAWVRTGRDAAHLRRVAQQDAARLEQ